MKLVKTATVMAGLLLVGATQVHSADYVIDTKGAHAAVQFKIKHLGYSWLLGRFNTFEGTFSYDEAQPNKAAVSVKIDTASIDSNHAERDKHLRSSDFLDVAKYPEATFKSTAYSLNDSGAKLTGNLTLHGVTKEIVIDVTPVGAGKDPWGGYRMGFEGEVAIKLKDFDINYNLGPASEQVFLYLSVEGIKQ